MQHDIPPPWRSLADAASKVVRDLAKPTNQQEQRR